MTAFFRAPRQRRLQRGAAAIEFTLAAAMALMLALLAVETARWQLTRQMAHLALVQAARAGSTGHADPARMRAAFLRALLPLYAGPGGTAGARRRQASDLDRGAMLMGTTPWRIEILRPAHGAAAAAPANDTLALRLTYLYRPLLAPLRVLLAALATADGSYAGHAGVHGLAPIGMELEMEMHAHARDSPPARPYPAGMVSGVCRRLHCPGMGALGQDQ